MILFFSKNLEIFYRERRKEKKFISTEYDATSTCARVNFNLFHWRSTCQPVPFCQHE